jgi:signal peptidase I
VSTPALAHAAPSSESRAAPKPTRARGLIEWALVAVVALALALLIKTFLVQPFSIPSGSMEPTLHVGDRVLVSKISYDLHGIHRGDIIVFKTPKTDTEPGVKDLIKRVIGLPGETIQSGPAGEVLINGQLINQPWLTQESKADPGPAIPRQVIPKGDYFVMGDNRGDSDDSRYPNVGLIPRSLVVGKAVAIVWPLSRIGSL